MCRFNGRTLRCVGSIAGSAPARVPGPTLRGTSGALGTYGHRLVCTTECTVSIAAACHYGMERVAGRGIADPVRAAQCLWDLSRSGANPTDGGAVLLASLCALCLHVEATLLRAVCHVRGGGMARDRLEEAVGALLRAAPRLHNDHLASHSSVHLELRAVYDNLRTSHDQTLAAAQLTPTGTAWGDIEAHMVGLYDALRADANLVPVLGVA
jgi:hypothetical protein